MSIRAVLFDMDGTVVDSPIDWAVVRREMGLPRDGRAILDQLEEKSAAEREHALSILHRFEAHGARNGTPIDGAVELLLALRDHGIRCALVTNNSRSSVDTILAKHPLPVDTVVCRDDGPTKPAPSLFTHALTQLGVSPEEAVAVGDAHYDYLGARAAGIREVILVSLSPWMKEQLPADAVYREAADLSEAATILFERIRRSR